LTKFSLGVKVGHAAVKAVHFISSFSAGNILAPGDTANRFFRLHAVFHGSWHLELGTAVLRAGN
jgi:hypothetical protein